MPRSCAERRAPHTCGTNSSHASRFERRGSDSTRSARSKTSVRRTASSYARPRGLRRTGCRERHPVPLHPPADVAVHAPPAEQREAHAGRRVELLEEREQLEAVRRVEAEQARHPRCRVEPVEVHRGVPGVPLADLHRREPEREVAGEVGGRSSLGQPGILALDGLARLLPRVREDRPDARLRRRQDADAPREERPLAVVRADDERDPVRGPVAERVERPLRQELAVDDRREADGSRVLVGSPQREQGGRLGQQRRVGRVEHGGGILDATRSRGRRRRPGG